MRYSEKLNGIPKGRTIASLYVITHLTLLLGASVSNAQKKPADKELSHLPSSSLHLVSRLEEFENREKEKLERTLNNKRKEVLVILRKHLKQQTQNGNLKQAVAIKAEIERIETLLTHLMPERLSPSIIEYEQSANIRKPEDVAAQFYIDGDQAKGKVHLKFKHPKLGQLFNTFDSIQLELKTANTDDAASTGSLIVTHKKKKLGEKIGIKRNEKILIPLEHWRITNVRDEVHLILECTSKDGVVIYPKSAAQTMALVFGKK